MESYGNYLGVLKWSLQQSDGTNPSEVKEMSQEDKEFFERAMEESCVSDVQRMNMCLKSIQEEIMTDEAKVTILSLLQEFLENLDNARDFQNISGYQIILDLLNSTEVKDIKTQCLGLLSTASQNQPQVQKILVDSKVLPQLIDLLRSSQDQTLKAKALGCISSIITGFPTGEQSFLFLNGLNALKDILFSSEVNTPMLRKCIFLITNLAQSQIMYMRKFLSVELVTKITSDLIVHEDIDIKEASITLLHVIVSLERTSFERMEVLPVLLPKLPGLMAYCLQNDIPDEVKQAISEIAQYVQYSN